VDDIRAHGLIEPILLCGGLVLDGRNRLRACELVGVAAMFEEWEPNGLTPVEFVLSKNLHRRHLTVAQRAALALDLLPHLEAEAKERQRLSDGRGHKGSPVADDLLGRSDEKAAELVGVGRTTVANAKAIQARDPEVIERMRTGEIATVAAAAREAGFEKLGQGATTILSDTIQDGRGKAQPAVAYGKGDKFLDATEPLRRYLRAWRGRDFEFRHVNFKEARRRLAVIDELTADLQAAREDLANRDEPARLTV
jgi:ParB-like chromosome segregation protein Spo0J